MKNALSISTFIPPSNKNAIVVARGYPYAVEFQLLENARNALGINIGHIRVDLLDDGADLLDALGLLEKCGVVSFSGFENTPALLDPHSGVSSKRNGTPGSLRLTPFIEALDRHLESDDARLFVLLIDRNTVLDKAITRPQRTSAFVDYTPN